MRRLERDLGGEHQRLVHRIAEQGGELARHGVALERDGHALAIRGGADRLRATGRADRRLAAADRQRWLAPGAHLERAGERDLQGVVAAVGRRRDLDLAGIGERAQVQPGQVGGIDLGRQRAAAERAVDAQVQALLRQERLELVRHHALEPAIARQRQHATRLHFDLPTRQRCNPR